VCFTGEQNPTFLYVDDIQFVKVSVRLQSVPFFAVTFILQPVNIGSVTEFSATVVYSREQYMVVQVRNSRFVGHTLKRGDDITICCFTCQVVALDVNPVNAVKSKTNIMRYVFK
jgi:hypothetical protein